jgi:regulation of enolase protein 1 (concanavalin A-like superfamily)
MQSPLTLFSSGQSGIDPHFQWHCQPASWSIDTVAMNLTIRPDEATDFWQRTHYGFRADNGHFLWAATPDDFEMTAEVSMKPLHQYDQAGLMVRLSPQCWLKTSVEYEDGISSRLGCVVTNRGHSDWSTQDVSSGFTDFALRVTRHSADYLVEANGPGTPWTQLRLAHLDEDSGSSSVQCGVYACSPKQAGLAASFRTFSLTVRGRE